MKLNLLIVLSFLFIQSSFSQEKSFAQKSIQTSEIVGGIATGLVGSAFFVDGIKNISRTDHQKVNTGAGLLIAGIFILADAAAGGAGALSHKLSHSTNCNQHQAQQDFNELKRFAHMYEKLGVLPPSATGFNALADAVNCEDCSDNEKSYTLSQIIADAEEAIESGDIKDTLELYEGETNNTFILNSLYSLEANQG